ncbi:MAG: hypothetical protein ACTSXU_17520 [Promethearchaeota archaeon]
MKEKNPSLDGGSTLKPTRENESSLDGGSTLKPTRENESSLEKNRHAKDEYTRGIKGESMQETSIMESRRHVLRISLIAIYSGTTVGMAYALLMFPNIELYSMMVFLGGLLYGMKIGALNGLVSTLVYRLFNPFGASLPYLLITQLAFYTLLGFIGGLFSRTKFRRSITKISQVIFGTIGSVVVLAYLVTADILQGLILGPSIQVVLLAGIPFYLISVFSNLVTFSLLMPLLLMYLDKHLSIIQPDFLH